MFVIFVAPFYSWILGVQHSQHPSYHPVVLRHFKEYLHSQGCVHGNVGARSVLVGGDLTAKLWGLGSAYRRRAQASSPGAVEDMEMRKWQAPEVLSRRAISHSSDVWVSEPPERILNNAMKMTEYKARHWSVPASVIEEGDSCQSLILIQLNLDVE